MHLFWRKKHETSVEQVNIARCGHAVPEDGLVYIFEEEIVLPRDDEGYFSDCPSCIEKESIRCAWCGHAIPYGSGITLYEEHGIEGREPRDDAVRYGESCHVGCLRFSCSYGFDMGGRWVEDEDNPGHGRVMHISDILRPDGDILRG